uniref:Uncharacterized protein n=1 Tax=Arundo donax TaxID=35708 RepID=A0A0A9F7R0_ARUDO
MRRCVPPRDGEINRCAAQSSASCVA